VDALCNFGTLKCFLQAHLFFSRPSSHGSAKETTTVAKTLTAVRLKDRDLKELEKLAKKEDETVSFLIRRAIREFLDRKATK
jgi:hypothetical protein